MSIKIKLGQAMLAYDAANKNWCVSHPGRIIDYYCDNIAVVDLPDRFDHGHVIDTYGHRAIIDVDCLKYFPHPHVIARSHGGDLVFGHCTRQ